MNQPFTWYRVTEYGTAEPVEDTPHISALIDNGERGYFPTIEGAILHGGVKATAFERKTEDTFDAVEWLRSGLMVRAGSVTITKITAEGA